MKFNPATAGRTLHLPESSSQAQHVHRERLRRRAGSAYARIDATGVELGRLTGVTKSTMSNRKSGQGPLALLLEEIHAWESAGHDTAPLLEAVIETQLDARPTLALCPTQVAIDEQKADAAEDEAQVAYLTGRGSAQSWRQTLLSHMAKAAIAVRTLAGAR